MVLQFERQPAWLPSSFGLLALIAMALALGAAGAMRGAAVLFAVLLAAAAIWFAGARRRFWLCPKCGDTVACR